MQGDSGCYGAVAPNLNQEDARLNTQHQRWLGRSLAIALLIGSAPGAIAHSPLPDHHSTSPVYPSELAMVMPNALELITWQLVSYRADDGSTVEALSDRPATLLFQDGQVSGTTGCNRFFNGYTLEGDQLTISSGGSTRMACISEALAAQENAILAGLPAVTSYTQTGEQLRLLDGDGTTLFTLMPQPTAELTGTEWTLTVYNNGRGGLQTPILDTTITAYFDAEKGLAGSAGCNRYTSSYEIKGDTMTIGAAASTRRLCAQPDGVMAQEAAFLALLPDVATYTISGNQLDLKNVDGTTLAQFTTEL